MGASAVGAIMQAAADIGGNIINSGGLALNRQTALRNLAMQKKAMLLNMLVQGKTWQREDNAVQRRVADLRKAGLSPVLAAGSAAQAAPARSIEAPQNEFQFPQWQTPDIAGVINSMRLTQSQVEKNTAETARINQLRALELLNNPSKLNLMHNKSRVALQDAMYKSMINAYYKELGIGPNSSEVGRTAADLTKIADTIIKGFMGDKRQQQPVPMKP